MTFALKPEDYYHTGIVVPDLDAAMERLSAVAGYTWITPLTYTLPFRTVNGSRELTSTFVYSLQAPHVELIQQVPESPWTAAAGNSVHHLGYFVDDLAETAKALEANGFAFEATADISPPDLALFAYYIDALRHPHRDRRPQAVSRLSGVPEVGGDAGRCLTGPTCCRSCASTSPRRMEMPRTQGELIRAAVELAQWGESRGIVTVSVDEHHATGHGWSCNPILAAGMFLAGTSTLIASVDCALGPLWNPVRLAEDIALVDNMSRGRLHTTVGLGYRASEYDALGLDFSQRGPLMDSLIERMLSVWSEIGSYTRPHPPLYVGGGARVTARRAARFRPSAQPRRPPA